MGLKRSAPEQITTKLQGAGSRCKRPNAAKGWRETGRTDLSEHVNHENSIAPRVIPIQLHGNNLGLVLPSVGSRLELFRGECRLGSQAQLSSNSGKHPLAGTTAAS